MFVAPVACARRGLGAKLREALHLDKGAAAGPVVCDSCLGSVGREAVVRVKCGHRFCGGCFGGLVQVCFSFFFFQVVFEYFFFGSCVEEGGGGDV